MKRRTIGTSLLIAGLLAGTFLAGGLLLKSGGGSAAPGAGDTGVVTATKTVTSTTKASITSTTTTASTSSTTSSATGSISETKPETTATVAPVVTQEPPVVTPEPPVITPEPEITPVPPVITPEPEITPVPPVITPEPPVVTPEPPVITPEPEVNEAPYVMTSAPADQQNHVATDASIKVTFSERMDEASTEAAFSINPAVSGQFSWDPKGRVMTFTPDADFAYNTHVGWQVSGSAQDADGLAMGADYTSSFWLLLQKTITLYSQPERDGFVYAPPVAALDKVITEGFNGHNSLKVGSWYRGFLSFDLSGLPASTVEITSAELLIHQRAHHPQAYTAETGSLWVVSVPYIDLDIGDYAAAPLQLCAQVCVPSSFLLSDSAANNWKSADLTFFVQKDWENSKGDGGGFQNPGGNERLSQFRLQFQKENKGAGPDVWAEFHSGEAGQSGAKLKVTIVY